MTLALTLSVFIGLSLGLLGGGGSILSVPILTYAVGMEPKSAIAASLLVIAVTSSAALVTHVRSGLVCWRTGVAFGGAGMAGAYAGGRLASLIPDGVLLGGFAAMMVVTAVAMLRRRPPARPDVVPQGAARTSRILAHGLIVGAVTGMIGAGGGFLIVPALVLLGGMPMRRAVATSVLVIAMKSSAGFAGYLGHAHVPWEVVLPITAVAAVSSVLGATLVKKVPQAMLRRGFAWLVVAVASFVVVRALPQFVRASDLYQHVFVQRWPWWFGAASVALVVLGLLFADNKQLGVSTGCSELCRIASDREVRSSWRLRLLLGVVIGGALAALFAGRAPTLAMGGLDQLAGGSLALKLGILFGAGVLIGAGARLAGGCTSGHGIVGTALGARSSWLATALFMVAGFVTTHLLLLLTGGHS
jgi:uncharacterized membrane protein YfcA/uncharacterized membrane protein YedE/YeeE